MIKHVLVSILAGISVFHQTHTEQSILDIKVICVTSPGERIEIEGYEKDPDSFTITGYKEGCYLFIKKQSPYTQPPTSSQVQKAAEEIVKVVHQ